MLAHYSRRLTGKARTYSANAELACFLSFVAGAVNAGGFFAVGEYTSHMTGIVSHMADMLTIGDLEYFFWGLGALMAFIAGSACTSMIINFARHRFLQSEYALPIFIEANGLIFFGVMDGLQLNVSWLWTPFTVATLCFIMGLQNAIITDISNFKLRSTHMTGTVTDIGIELGKAFYWNRAHHTGPKVSPVRANMKKLWLLVEVLILFFIGGVSGAIGYKYFGFSFTIYVGLVLVYISSMPLVDDFRQIIKRFNSPPIVSDSTPDVEKESIVTTAQNTPDITVAWKDELSPADWAEAQETEIWNLDRDDQENADTKEGSDETPAETWMK